MVFDHYLSVIVVCCGLSIVPALCPSPSCSWLRLLYHFLTSVAFQNISIFLATGCAAYNQVSLWTHLICLSQQRGSVMQRYAGLAFLFRVHFQGLSFGLSLSHLLSDCYSEWAGRGSSLCMEDWGVSCPRLRALATDLTKAADLQGLTADGGAGLRGKRESWMEWAGKYIGLMLLNW